MIKFLCTAEVNCVTSETGKGFGCNAILSDTLEDGSATLEGDAQKLLFWQIETLAKGNLCRGLVAQRESHPEEKQHTVDHKKSGQ